MCQYIALGIKLANGNKSLTKIILHCGISVESVRRRGGEGEEQWQLFWINALTM